MTNERLSKIQQHLYTHGHSHVQELADAIGTSVITIRRDLQRLEETGVIQRTHGGAKLADAAAPEVAFQTRQQENIEVKRAIAEAAFELLRPYSTVFMDAGTTVLQLARRLRVEPLPITVYTNGLAVAQELLNLSDVNVNLIGGHLRHENLSLVGPYAERFLQEIWFDQLFLGTSAVRLDRQMYTLNPAEASLNRTMIQRCTEAVLLTDSRKFSGNAPYTVAPLSIIHRLITDDQLEASWRTYLQNIGLETTLVSTRSAS